MSKAVEFYTLAANQGHANAQYNLGACYYNGEGVAKDLSKAVEFYTLAAKQGDAGAQNSLGIFYGTGQGVVKDLSKAVKFWTLAANQGHANAQYNLGACYYNGEGVVQDLSEAARLYKLAAEQGIANAPANLGALYANGQGVVKDLSKAVRLYELAAKQGHTYAQENLKTLENSSRQEQESPSNSNTPYIFGAAATLLGGAYLINKRQAEDKKAKIGNARRQKIENLRQKEQKKKATIQTAQKRLPDRNLKAADLTAQEAARQAAKAAERAAKKARGEAAEAEREAKKARAKAEKEKAAEVQKNIKKNQDARNKEAAELLEKIESFISNSATKPAPTKEDLQNLLDYLKKGNTTHIDIQGGIITSLNLFEETIKEVSKANERGTITTNKNKAKDALIGSDIIQNLKKISIEIINQMENITRSRQSKKKFDYLLQEIQKMETAIPELQQDDKSDQKSTTKLKAKTSPNRTPSRSTPSGPSSKLSESKQDKTQEIAIIFEPGARLSTQSLTNEQKALVEDIQQSSDSKEINALKTSIIGEISLKLYIEILDTITKAKVLFKNDVLGTENQYFSLANFIEKINSYELNRLIPEKKLEILPILHKLGYKITELEGLNREKLIKSLKDNIQECIDWQLVTNIRALSEMGFILSPKPEEKKQTAIDSELSGLKEKINARLKPFVTTIEKTTASTISDSQKHQLDSLARAILYSEFVNKNPDFIDKELQNNILTRFQHGSVSPSVSQNKFITSLRSQLERSTEHIKSSWNLIREEGNSPIPILADEQGRPIISTDLALVIKKKIICIEFDGPHHFDNQGNPTPKTQARNELGRAIAKERRRSGEKVHFMTISYEDLELGKNPLTIISKKIRQAEELDKEEEKRAFMGDEKTTEELHPVATGQQDIANLSEQSRIDIILQDIVSIAIRSQGGNDNDITADVAENYTDSNRQLKDGATDEFDLKLTLAEALQNIVTQNSIRGGAESKTETTTANLDMEKIKGSIASLPGLKESDQKLNDSELPQKLKEYAKQIIEQRNKQTEEQKGAETAAVSPSTAPKKSTTLLSASAPAFNPDKGPTR